MKRIGIVIRDFWENDKLFVGCRKDVIDVFLKYKVEIILIPIYISFDKVRALLELCDGVVLSGGNHFLDNDFRLVKYLYTNDIPTLGICLGMQVMGLSLGGEEINVDEGHNNDWHNVKIKKNTLLYSIIKEEHILVNSRHKTGVKNSMLIDSAIASDGVIEAVEDRHKRFFLGVEWHPETDKNKKSDLIFEAFIKSLKE